MVSSQPRRRRGVTFDEEPGSSKGRERQRCGRLGRGPQRKEVELCPVASDFRKRTSENASSVGCRIHIIAADWLQIVPDSTDQINALAVGAAYTSTATDGVWLCTYASAGKWTVVQSS